MLRSARQQLKAFAIFASHPLGHLENNQTQQPVAEITRVELMNVGGASSATIKALTDRPDCSAYRKLGHLASRHHAPEKLTFALLTRSLQQHCVQFLKKRVVLLHGVISSKIECISISSTKLKNELLYLLPEIALTVQMTTRLKRVFGQRLGIYHSRYSDANMWRYGKSSFHLALRGNTGRKKCRVLAFSTSGAGHHR